MKTIRITHFYNWADTSDGYVIAESPDCPNPKRAAIFCQFMCEEWFGNSEILTNTGVAELLVRFYGFKHADKPADDDDCEIIDMHVDRERFGNSDKVEVGEKLSKDTTLLREGLREAMGAYIDGRTNWRHNSRYFKGCAC